LYRSTNNGLNWSLMTAPPQYNGSVSIVQGTRLMLAAGSSIGKSRLFLAVLGATPTPGGTGPIDNPDVPDPGQGALIASGTAIVPTPGVPLWAPSRVPGA
jgi:hypothetical protein